MEDLNHPPTVAVARILDLLHRPSSKKTGRARGPCRAELVDLYAQNVPARRPAPTNFQRALFGIVIIQSRAGKDCHCERSEAISAFGR